MRKLVALFLTVIMLLSAMPISVCASVTEYDDYYNLSDSDKEVVGRLEALDIMFGKDDSFDPSGILTRAEATAILARINGITEEQASQECYYSAFDDVETGKWYTGYINLSKSKGIVKGTGHNNFAPERELTYQEMLAMLTRTLGAEQLVASLGTWPTNYTNFAIDNGLVEGVGRNFTAEINRLETARLVSNALEANQWETFSASTDGTATYAKSSTTLLEGKLKVDVYNSYDERDGKDEDKGYIVRSVDVKDREVSISNIGTRDVADFVDMSKILVGMEVDVWLDSNKDIIRIVQSNNTSQETIVIEEIKSVTSSKITLKQNSKSKAYNFVDEDDLIVYINGEEIEDDLIDEIKDALDTDDKKENTFGQLILDEKSKVTHVFLEQYSSAILVDKVDEDDEKIVAEDDIKGSTCKDLKLEDLSYTIKNAKGAEISLSDIDEGDTVLYYKGKGDVDYGLLVLSTNEVEGKIKSVGSDYIKIDNTKYYVNTLINSESLINKMKVKQEVTLYLDTNDHIVMYEGEAKASGEYAIVTSARAYTDEFGEVGAKITITDFDGEEIDGTIDIEETEGEDGFDKTIFASTTSNLNTQMYIGSDTVKPLLGTVIRANTNSSDEIEIVEFSDSFANPRSGYGSDDEDEIIELKAGYKINVDKERLNDTTGSGLPSYRITDDTVVMVEKSTSKAYTTSVEEIDWEDLNDSTTTWDGQVIICDIDEDSNEVGLVFIRGSVSRNNAAHFAVIESMSKADEDMLDVDAFSAEDSSLNLEIEDSSIKRADVKKYIGALVCYSEDGTSLYEPEFKLANTTNLTKAQVYSVNESSGVIRLCKEGKAEVEWLELSENVIYIECEDITIDSNGKYSFTDMDNASSLGVNYIESGYFYGTDPDCDEYILYYMIDTDNDGILDEIAAIFYIDD